MQFEQFHTLDNECYDVKLLIRTIPLEKVWFTEQLILFMYNLVAFCQGNLLENMKTLLNRFNDKLIWFKD